MASALRFLGQQGEQVDEQLATDLARLGQLSAEQAGAFLTIILEHLAGGTGQSALQGEVGAFAGEHGIKVGALRPIMLAYLQFFTGATKNNLSEEHVAADLGALGVGDDAVAAARELWARFQPRLARAVLDATLTYNELVDMEWKFGVTAASSELRQVGTSFLQVKLVLDKGGGRRENIFLELTLQQFYDFLKEMENAKKALQELS